jgi:Tfp pilus assembly protein PilX
MKKNHKYPPQKDGFALLLVLFFVAAMSTFLTMLAVSSSQRAFTTRRLTHGIKAQAIAEAGCEQAYAILSTNWAARYDPSAFTSADEDSQLSSASVQSSSANNAKYQLNVVPVEDSAVLVTSTGTYNSATAVSIVSIQNIGGSDDNGDVLSGEAFEYAILCGGEFDFSGCGSIVSASGTAKFHANGDMFLRGNTDALINLTSSTSITINNNVTVGGDVTAPELSYKSKKVTFGGDAIETTVNVVEIPDIDLTPYYNWALEHDEVYDGFTCTSDLTPNGGILWVNGDVHISSHAVITGSIIATGDINMSGQVDVNPTDYSFSLVSRDGDIQITSSGTITGLIYAKTGGLQHTANGEIIGQVIVNGNIKKAGNSDIMTSFATYVPSPPSGSTTTDYIAITAWQK